MKEKRYLKRFYLSALILLTVFFVGVIFSAAKENVKPAEPGYNDKGGIMNDELNRNESLDPKNPGFYSSSLLRWSPEQDPDAEFSRSRVPLRTGRFYGPAVNEQATPGAKIQTWSNNTIVPSSQGSATSSDYAFTHWQYVDTVCGWGVGGGLFCIPQAHLIDAAHRNGVPVTALIGYPTGGSEDGKQEFNEMVQQDSEGNFPVADKMAEVAYYYGFDGYVYNQEMSGLSYSGVAKLRDFHIYFRKKYPNLIFNWYDSMTYSSGGVSYQNGVSGNNIGWVRSFNKFSESDINKLRMQGLGRPYLMDDIFTNYNFGADEVNQSVNLMRSNDRSPFDAYHAFELQQYSWVKPKPGHPTGFQSLLDSNNKLKTSIGFFCADSTLNLSTDLESFHDIETKFWTTSTEDPRLEPRAPRNNIYEDKWAGMASLINDRSIINQFPFTTNFQTGHGNSFYIDGKEGHNRPWTYKGLQDIAPTWTWMVDTDQKRGDEMIKDNGNIRPANLLRGRYDFSDAFWGGNHVKFSGNLEANNGQTMKLYSTKLNQNGDTEVELIYKEINSNNKTKLYFSFTRKADYNLPWENIELISKETINGWTKATCIIPKGETITGVGLRVMATENLNDYSLKLGQLNMLGDTENVDKIKNFYVDDLKMSSSVVGQARVKAQYQSSVMTYEVYKLEKDGSWTFVKAMPNSNMYLDYIYHEINDGTDVTIKMVPVDFNNRRHDELASTTIFTWKEVIQTNKSQNFGKNIAQGSKILYTNDLGGSSERIENVFDGTTEGFRKFTKVNSSLKLNFIWEPKENLPVNQIWVGQGNLLDGPNNASVHNTRSFEIWGSDEVEQIGGGGWLDYTYDENTGKLLAQGKKYRLKNPTKIMETNNDQSQGIWKKLDNPVQYRYYEYKTISNSTSPWGVQRLFEIYMWTGTDQVLSPQLNAANVSLQRTTTGLANLKFTNVLRNSEIKLYRNQNDTEPFATKNTYNYHSLGSPYTSASFCDVDSSMLYEDVTFNDINIGGEQGVLYYEIEHHKYKYSNRFGIKYFAEDASDSTPIAQSDISVSKYQISNITGKTRAQYGDITIRNLHEGDIVYLEEGAVDKGFPQSVDKPGYDQNNIDWSKRRREVVVGKGQTEITIRGVCTGVEKDGKRLMLFRITRLDQATGKFNKTSADTFLDCNQS